MGTDVRALHLLNFPLALLPTCTTSHMRNFHLAQLTHSSTKQRANDSWIWNQKEVEVFPVRGPILFSKKKFFQDKYRYFFQILIFFRPVLFGSFPSFPPPPSFPQNVPGYQSSQLRNTHTSTTQAAPKKSVKNKFAVSHHRIHSWYTVENYVSRVWVHRPSHTLAFGVFGGAHIKGNEEKGWRPYWGEVSFSIQKLLLHRVDISNLTHLYVVSQLIINTGGNLK